jgi:hypothetical protein
MKKGKYHYQKVGAMVNCSKFFLIIVGVYELIDTYLYFVMSTCLAPVTGTGTL